MKISIVIPNWNGAGKLKKNLPKVLEVARLNKIEEVIVSDDASTDESLKILKTDFPKVVVLESSKKHNSGFSSNVNRGVRKTGGDLIVLLNSDAVPESNFLDYTLPHFNNPQVFSVGCNAGGLWSTAKFENGFFRHNQVHQTASGKAKAHITLWVSGGSGVFRKNIWDQLGGLDPLYNPFYVEDLDLGYRAWKRGYVNIWEPRSLVEHYQEKGVIESNFSKTEIQNVAERNMLIFTWKNISSEQLIDEHRKALVKMLILHPKYWGVFLTAFQRLPQILRRREIEKKEAKISDEEIFRLFADDRI